MRAIQVDYPACTWGGDPHRHRSILFRSDGCRRRILDIHDQSGPEDAKENLAEADAPAHAANLMKHTIFDTPVLRPVLRFLSLLLLRAIGWKQGGQAPEAAKYVLIAAPHTSNWDYLLLMAITLRFKVKLYWMGKDSLFKAPYGWLVKYLGGIPIDRSKKTGMVAQTIETFRQTDRLAITIPAEGTRSKTQGWKSGFYHIARGADVPVVLGFLDYDKKIGGFGPEITLTGDTQADMAIIADFYADIGAKYPDKKTDPRLDV